MIDEQLWFYQTLIFGVATKYKGHTTEYKGYMIPLARPFATFGRVSGIFILKGVIMWIVFIIIVAFLTFGAIGLLFFLAHKQDKRRQEINAMLKEHKKNKEK